MYTIWDVTFRIRTDNRGPSDPLFRTEPPARGSVGDVDPFSDSFGRALDSVEDSFRLRSVRHELASSVTSDVSDFFSLHSSVQDTPFTPNTERSISSRFEPNGPTSRKPCQPATSPNLDYHVTNLQASTLSPALTREKDVTSNATSVLPPLVENADEKHTSDTAGASSAATVKSESINDLTKTRAPAVKRRRKKKAPFSMPSRPPVKTREQHLADNKAAASRCRQQRKAWETHLQEASLMLQASIKQSRSTINELGNELASLKRQLWECPDCTDRYVYSRGLESNEKPTDQCQIDTLISPSDPLTE